MKKNVLIYDARREFHHNLVTNGVLSISRQGVASNADPGNTPSIQIARRIAESLGANVEAKLKGQTAGKLFEKEVEKFLQTTFLRLQDLRPGTWGIQALGNRNSLKTWDFAQYEHLADLARLVEENKKLSTLLNVDYFVSPDIVIYRELYEDALLNQNETIVNDVVCKLADLRKSNGGKPILHASVSVKWTMRSDRAQNSRTEALNLIRTRKGKTPHIVVVTGEPTPSRIASLALGTGDVDCVYHFALYELLDAVAQYGSNGREDLIETLNALVEGKRLKDISDLPLDLAE